MYAIRKSDCIFESNTKNVVEDYEVEHVSIKFRDMIRELKQLPKSLKKPSPPITPILYMTFICQE
jgi:hypothetical protein